MNKQAFLDYCQKELIAFFGKSKQHKKDLQQKYRLEGVIHAGKLVGLLSPDEAISLVEDAHYKVFNETIEAHTQRKINLRDAVKRGDEEYIDIPAYERLKK